MGEDTNSVPLGAQTKGQRTVDVVHGEAVGEVGQVGLLSEWSLLHLLWFPIIQTLQGLSKLSNCADSSIEGSQNLKQVASL